MILLFVFVKNDDTPDQICKSFCEIAYLFSFSKAIKNHIY